MRPLELVLILLLAAVPVSSLVSAPIRSRLRRGAGGGALLVLGAHLLVEGHRWPMVPAYVITTLLILKTSWNWLRRRSADRAVGRGRSLWQRVLVGAGGLLGVGALAALPTLFPQIRLPEPTGPYGIGTADLLFIDRQRPETFTPDPDDRREIAARIWYPAEPVGRGAPVPYMENATAVSRAITGSTPFPPFLFSHLGRVPTHAWRDAPVVREDPPFPVVVFNHAYWAGIPQSTALMEELASHGYASVSVGHAFETPYFVRPDGSVQAFDARNAEFAQRGRERTEASAIEQQLTTTRDVRRLGDLIRELSRRRPKMVESLHIWVADVRAVLDELERRSDGGDPLAGRLDTDHMAVMGHSFGGAAAGQACLDDSRCKAGINFDGLQVGDMLDRPIETPFLFFHHDNAGARNRAPNLPFFEQARAPAYLAIVAGTGHMSFSDICLHPRTSLFRLASPGGTIDGRRCQAIVNACVLAFLDRHLRGRDEANLEAVVERFPEVELQVRRPR